MSHACVRRAHDVFERSFGREPEWIARAPGRVNLIGEHTDYNEGFVLPMAIDRFVVVAGSPTIHEKRSRLVAADLGEMREVDVTRTVAEGSFVDYAIGVLQALGDRGIEPPPFEAVIASNLPRGSGLSSSAALDVALTLFFARLAGAEIAPLDVALVAQAAENRFVGVQCGIMDPFVIAHGRDGCALKIDCRAMVGEEVPARIDGFDWQVLHSGVVRALAKSEYNQRRAECERAVAAVRARHPEVRALRDVSIEEIEEATLDDVARRRARHVIAENERVVACERALRRCDVTTIGRLFAESHASLRDLYEVSCPELDERVARARAEGAVAARMTGAGFGGSILALSANGVRPRTTGLDVGIVSPTGVEPRCWRTRD
ncbi:MAG: galactokinase [Planctomycetes bacterium]|nr:galactokinase [Planctomycetota bacterium]MBI3844088.1 galactokinase [Planctomycetota bacterium]